MSIEERNIRVAAWGELLLVYGDRGLNLTAWGDDYRMGLLLKDVVNDITSDVRDGVLYPDRKTFDMVYDVFGSDSISDAVMKGTQFEHMNSRSYPFSTIPRDFYLRVLNPELDTQFNEISDLLVDWFNQQKQSTINKLLKTEGISEWNSYRWALRFGDAEIVTIYRGLKSEPVDEQKGFSSWTYDIKQAERFATYNFVGQYVMRPVYSKEGYILTTTITEKDVSVFVDMDESEIVLKNPVRYTVKKIR
jgi:hypothetical protein